MKTVHILWITRWHQHPTRLFGVYDTQEKAQASATAHAKAEKTLLTNAKLKWQGSPLGDINSDTDTTGYRITGHAVL